MQPNKKRKRSATTSENVGRTFDKHFETGSVNASVPIHVHDRPIGIGEVGVLEDGTYVTSNGRVVDPIWYALTNEIRTSFETAKAVDVPYPKFVRTTPNRFESVDRPNPRSKPKTIVPNTFWYVRSAKPPTEGYDEAEREWDERSKNPERYPAISLRPRGSRARFESDGTRSFGTLEVSPVDGTRRSHDENADPKEFDRVVGPVLEATHVPPIRPLRTMDVFAGCGGASEGFRMSGLCRSEWAIETNPNAAESFRKNHPGSIVFEEDCTDVLRRSVAGEELSAGGKRIPKPGEVEALVGGPPCQGYSRMNKFAGTEKYQYSNSLVATYLSYCDRFRPRLFVLENVANFAAMDDGKVLELTIRALLDIGYQCTFEVLQAGSFGVPQSRRRFVLIAVPLGERLPWFPEPTHAFNRSESSFKVRVGKDEIRFGCDGPAPLPRTTVRDAISDLATSDGTYASEPTSEFQRKLRVGSCSTPTSHEVRKQSAINAYRMRLVPTYPGADWRDVPDLPGEILSDGTVTTSLRETIKGDTCTIPASFYRTAERNSKWAGNYGRPRWSGFFGTTLTRPEPIRKQGVSLHPDLPRLLTFRELARSQGFPDAYEFHGTPPRVGLQIGNAVPPLLFEAVGKEICKSMVGR